MINTTILAKWIGNPTSLIVHVVVIGGLLLLRSFGVITSSILAALTTTAALEAIFLVIFLQMEVNKNYKNVCLMQKKISEIQSEETETHKLMVNVLHIAHQMKSMQQNLGTLKKGKTFKNLDNTPRIHA